MDTLSNDQIQTAIETLSGWSYEANQLVKTFEFGSFREAVSFMVRLAFEAEQRDHHPRLVNVYNKVEISLTTHDAGNQVTARDVELAQAIERLSWV